MCILPHVRSSALSASIACRMLTEKAAVWRYLRCALKKSSGDTLVSLLFVHLHSPLNVSVVEYKGEARWALAWYKTCWKAVIVSMLTQLIVNLIDTCY